MNYQFFGKKEFLRTFPKSVQELKLGFKYYLSLIGVKGNMAYEYNPLHNYRLTEDTDINGLHPKLALFINKKSNTKEILTWKIDSFYKNGSKFYKRKYENGVDVIINEIPYDIIVFNDNESAEGFISGGTIVDLDTEHLNFSLNNPVEIEAQPSYDGSVNLILNDNRNIPRLINTRFTTRLLNTYEVVDRVGDNDTNLYDDSQFELDTSLYKRVDKIPRVNFNGVNNFGNLKVGNYTFYFKYCDADDNETDFVELSGVISIFKGNDSDPFSIDGGVRDMLAYKSISFTLSNIDLSYDYIKVYYTRTSADLDENRLVTAYKINKKFVVRKGICLILVTGEENVTDIAVSDINALYFLASKALTLTLCQNRLFLGNLSKPDIAYLDLTDISLRILPYLNKEKSYNLIGKVDPKTYTDYSTATQPYEYYNTKNIYYYLGYWPEEIYRLGIVYIMPDNSLSPVFNIRGCKDIPTFEKIADKYSIGEFSIDELYTLDGDRTAIKVDEENYKIISGKDVFENSKGVIKIPEEDDGELYIYSIGIFIPETIINYLRDVHKIKGFFLVRLKRIPTILALAYTLPREPSVLVPLLCYGTNNDPTYAVERFLKDDLVLTNDYSSRLYTTYSDSTKRNLLNTNNITAICPEFEVRQSYFNQFFTGTEYPIKINAFLPDNLVLSENNLRFYYTDYNTGSKGTDQWSQSQIISITEEVPLVAIGDTIFRGVVGSAEEAHRFRYAELDNKVSNASNLVRGIYFPYLGLSSSNNIKCNKLITIYIPGFSLGLYSEYFKIRYEDDSPYYPITERVDINNFGNNWDIKTTKDFDNIKGYKTSCYRGDCYICNFTHRLNRNFQDPEAPTNDEIIDENTWKDNYNLDNQEDFIKINRGDVNAVQLGSWITIRVRSSYNLSIRSLDTSHGGEIGLTGIPRGFYPLLQLTIQGNNKIPNSYLINDGFGATTGEKQFFNLPDVPYIKNNFENRVLYSDIAINDAFKNGYRVFKSTAFRDYKKEYGSIRRLIEFNNSIICVFEHAVASIAVNERQAIGGLEGNEIFINSNNVLPENIAIVSDMFGSQWPESVLKTPYFVYGIDTVGKKIWRTNGKDLEVISDFKMNKFLIDNISLSERELTPIIGIRNVKTHYNANKNDVMFTFYDNTYGFEETVWNLCYNEISQKFTTFYSWVPSYSANIDNIFFSYNRKTSKYISKLGTSLINSTSADGIVVLNSVIEPNNNNIISIELNDGTTLKYPLIITYIPEESGIVNRTLPVNNSNINIVTTYYLCKDNFRNYEYFNNNLKQERDTWELEYVEGLGYKLEFSANISGLPSKVEKPLEVEVPEIENAPEVMQKPIPVILGDLSYIEFVKKLDTFITECLNYILYINTLLDYYKEYTDYTSYLSELSRYYQFLIDISKFKLKYSHIEEVFNSKEVWLLNIKASIKIEDYTGNDLNIKLYISNWKNYTTSNYGYYNSVVALASKDVLNNPLLTEDDKKIANLTTDFWKHGLAGIIDINETIKPTNWYGEQHPFEFEFVVRGDTANMHKIFTNLEIVSNSAEPESFHFDIIGDSYEFSDDKANMYYRLELTKLLYLNLGSDILYDHDYNEILPKQRPIYDQFMLKSLYYDKSTIFPWYYRRVDTFNEIYDYYTLMGSGNTAKRGEGGKDYKNLSGSEVIWDKTTNEFRIRTHIVNSPIDKFGRMRGNSQYLEDRWKIQIPSIVFALKNEVWNDNKPPIVITNLPEDILIRSKENIYYRWNIEKRRQVFGELFDPETPFDRLTDYQKSLIVHTVTLSDLDDIAASGASDRVNNIYTLKDITTDPWTYRKEAKIKDKYMRVRIRYTGDRLAVITAVLTTYLESYA